MMDISRKNIVSFIDTILNVIPYLSLIAVIGVTAYLLCTENYYYLSKAAFILVSVAVISIIIIINRKTIQKELTLAPPDKTALLNIPSSTLTLIYSILFVVTVIVSLLSQEFTTLFLLLILGLYGVTILHIFSNHNGKSGIILFELIATTLLFIFVKYLSYEYLSPICDTIFHINHADLILAAGFVPGGFDGYGLYPAYHILFACSSLITGLSTYVAAHIPHIALIVVCGIFVFCAAKKLSKSTLIAELSVFFYFLLPGTLQSLSILMPMIVAGIVFFIFLYLLFIDKNEISNTSRWILTAVFLLFFVSVHHASSIFYLPVFTLILLICWLYQKRLSLGQIITAVLAYLIIGSKLIYGYLPNMQSILQNYIGGAINGKEQEFTSVLSSEEVKHVVNEGVSVVNEGVSVVNEGVSVVNEGVSVVNEGVEAVIVDNSTNLTYLFNTAICVFITLFIYLAICYLISRKCNLKTTSLKLLLPLLVIFFIFMFPNVIDLLLGFDVISLLTARCSRYMAPIFAIGMGLGCFVLFKLCFKKLKAKKAASVVCIFLCILCIIAGPLVSNGAGTYSILGDDIYTPSKGSFFTTSEISSLETAKQIIPEYSKVATDYLSDRYLTEMHGYSQYGIHDFKPVRGGIYSLLMNNSDEMILAPYLLFREMRYDDGGLSLWETTSKKGGYKFDQLNALNFEQNTYEYNKIYDNCATIIHYGT